MIIYNHRVITYWYVITIWLYNYDNNGEDTNHVYVFLFIRLLASIFLEQMSWTGNFHVFIAILIMIILINCWVSKSEPAL